MSQVYNVRSSNIELLRIICMFLILLHHGVVHGGYDFNDSLSINKIFLSLFIFGGKFSVDVFVLITGYFLCLKDFNIDKFSKLIGQIVFYSVLVFLIVTIGYHNTLAYNIKNIIFNFYPYQGFALNYIYLYALSPMLNLFIRNINKKATTIFILILTVSLSVLPTFLPRFNGFNLLFWMIYLYFIGAYIRLNLNLEILKNTKNKLLIYTISLLMLNHCLSAVSALFIKNSVLSDFFYWYNIYTFYRDDSLLLLLAAITFLLYFLKLNIRSKWINTVSKYTFGVLLLHDNSFRSIIFKNILDFPNYYNEIYFPIYFIFSLCIVYVLGIIVDFIRAMYFEQFMKKNIKKLLENVIDWLEIKVVFFMKILTK